MKLNNQQEKAAKQLEGNLLIIASAGTGKTTTIIERYINLIENKGVEPSQIMMTTFTNKAAKDMVEKIKKRTNKISPYIGTMHSLFLRILRDHSDLIFSDRPFTLLTDDKEKNKIVKDILKNEEIENTNNAVKYFSSWISKYKNRGIFSDELSFEGGIDDLKKTGQITEMLDDQLIKVNPQWRKSVNKVYKRYQEFLDKNNLLDFDEILMKTFTLFANFTKIKEKYRDNFKSIMIDEAQDLNLIQKRILDQISSENICFIGDDCQNIYEWRGSSNEIIFDFSEIENSIFLEKNYRSSDQIIQAINNSIKEMKYKIHKKIVPTKGLKKDIVFEEYFQSIEEASNIADKVEGLLQQKENPEDIAILFRTRIIGKTFEKELIKKGIPCHLSKSLGFFEREEIKDIISLLRLKINRESFFDFEKSSKIIFGLGGISLKKIKEYALSNKLGLQDTLSNLDKIKISDKIKDPIKNLFNSLNSGDIDQILVDLGYYEYLDSKYAKEPSKLEDKHENIETFILMYKENYDSILEFLDSLHESEKREKSEGKVTLSTIHSAKGLEWKHVFLVGCNEGILPYYKGELTAIKKDSELRLFYVAISRAKEGLYISSHFTNRFENYEPSQFLEII
jgi:DNA helicase-2/ATP-dependent DNA helicase PcrA